MQAIPPQTERLEQRIRECMACGYSLEGLAPDGLCPECGRAFHGDEFRVAGVSGVLFFGPVGCGLIAFAIPLLSTTLFFFDNWIAGLLVITLVLCGVVYSIRQSPRDTSRQHSDLFLMHDELRIGDALAFRWSNVSDVSLKRSMVGWTIVFKVGSLAFRPRFHFRGDRGRAEALRDLIAQRAKDARAR